jgi:L-ascorbate metabolism protein UlaG (beta-lactamase superfamily)
VRLTLVGGPTLLVEFGGLRLLTDPTFDAPGEYASGNLTLTKVRGPALDAAALGPVDAVLLSHDQHADNLDPSGRRFLESVPATYTTRAGAARLGGSARGLQPWETVPLDAAVSLTATPARHGPAGIEPISGDVIGFALGTDGPGDVLYLTGDTVFYEGVAEAARRFRPRVVVIFAGAARTRGPFDLTMATNDALDTAYAFPGARIVPVHTEGWAHFTESFEDLDRAFSALGRADRLVRLQPGRPVELLL